MCIRNSVPSESFFDLWPLSPFVSQVAPFFTLCASLALLAACKSSRELVRLISLSASRPLPACFALDPRKPSRLRHLQSSSHPCCWSLGVRWEGL